MPEEKLAAAKIDEELIKVGVKVHSCEEAISAMGAILVEHGYVKKSYIQALLDREKEFPTGLMTAGGGVAIPHADVSHVNNTTTAVWVLENSIPFHVMGGDEDKVINVNIIFMLAIANPQEHLPFLQKLMDIFQKEDVMLSVKQAVHPGMIAEILNKAIYEGDRK